MTDNIWPLDREKMQKVLRIGNSNDRVTKGQIYYARWQKTFGGTFTQGASYNWVITTTDDPGKKTQPVLKENSKHWECLGPCGNYDTQKKPEKIKPEKEIMSDTFISIKEGCIVNGVDATQFSDEVIINMLVEQNKRFEALKDKLGESSKYFQSKGKAIANDISALQKLLDSRA